MGMPNISLIEGFPDNLYTLTNRHKNSLVVLDDMMADCSKDQHVSDLFMRGSHHRGILVRKLSRRISLNSHYMLIFKNLRDLLGIAT